MIGSRTIVGMLALLLMVVSAHAFQETAPGQTPVPTSATSASGDESGLGLADEEGASTPSSVASGGPNLNFGLELLYGGKASPSAVPDDDPVGLRLRHSF